MKLSKLFKNIIISSLLIIITIFIVNIFQTHSSNSADIELQKKALLATAKSFYRKGLNTIDGVSYIQYDSIKRYLYDTPEDATSNHTIFTDCSGFVWALYNQVLGIKIPENTDALANYATERAKQEGATDSKIDFAAGVVKSKSNTYNILFNMKVKTNTEFKTDSNGNGVTSDGKYYIYDESEMYENIKKLMSKDSDFKWQTGDIIVMRYIDGTGHVVMVDASDTSGEIKFIEASSKNNVACIDSSCSGQTFYGNFYRSTIHEDPLEFRTIFDGTSNYVTGSNSFMASSSHFPTSCFASYNKADDYCNAGIHKITNGYNGTYPSNGQYYLSDSNYSNDGKFISLPSAFKQLSIIRFITDGTNAYTKPDSSVTYTIKPAAKFRLSYPDLDVEKTVEVSNEGRTTGGGNTNVTPGDVLTYKISLKNTGTTTYNDIRLRETFDKNIDYLSYSINGGSFSCTNDSQYLTCANLSVQGNKTLTITYKVKIKEKDDLIGTTISSTGFLYNSDDGYKRTRLINHLVTQSLTKDEENKILNYAKDTSISENNYDYIVAVYNKLGVSLPTKNQIKTGIIKTNCNSSSATCRLKDLSLSSDVSKYVLGNYYGVNTDTYSSDGINKNYSNNKWNILNVWNWYTIDNKERARDILISDLQVGDIIANITDDEYYLYLGNGNVSSNSNIINSSLLANKSKTVNISNKERNIWTNYLSSMLGKEYMILRPSQVLNKDYDGGTITEFITSDGVTSLTSRDIQLSLKWSFSDNVLNVSSSYCINTENNISGCTWHQLNGNSANISYNIPSSIAVGNFKLYAFVKRNSSGIITNSKELSLTLNATRPTINTFYIGGESNPLYATSITSSIYLTWNDNNVVSYCINTSDSTNGCSWKSTNGKSVNEPYQLTSINGNKTLYAFIKDENDNISYSKNDSIILDTIKPTINVFYIGGESNPSTITSSSTKVYLTWSDTDVTDYCISTTSSSTNCKWNATNSQSVNVDYTLNNNTGLITLYAFIKDNAGNISSYKDDSVTISSTTVAPIINEFYIGGKTNPTYATSTKTSIYLAWNDSSVTHYCISKTNNNTDCEWKNASGTNLTIDYNLDSGDGQKTLYAFIKNTEVISNFKSDDIILDTTKPTIDSFYIGGIDNPELITDTNTTIYLTWQDEDVTDYCISTTDNSRNCEWIKTSEKIINTEYILNGKNGEITLYAFIKDKAGLISSSKLDTITLNSTKPLIETFYIGGTSNPKYATSINSSIYLKWTEDNITDYCISTTNNSDECSWQKITGTSVSVDYILANGDGIKKLYAYIKNADGLISNVASDNIILDTVKPIIETFYIGGLSNPKYITSENISIYATWQDRDVVSYCISLTNSSSNCKWENISTNILNTTYNLANENGEKKLYLYIKDEAEHISEVKEDSIILDTIKPEIKEFYIGEKDTKKITDNKVKITIIFADEDVSDYCISTTNSSTSCKWVNVTEKKIIVDYIFDEENGEKILYSFIKDKAGNISKMKETKVILEIIVNSQDNLYDDENKSDTPLNDGPQTGTLKLSVLIFIFLIIAIVAYKIIKNKKKLFKI